MASPLHLPAHRYGCTSCGISCSMFDEIAVDPRSEEKLREIDFRALLPSELRDLDPVVPSIGSPGKKMLRKLGLFDPCSFFDPADRLCSIHREHGLEHKPQACKDFPFRFVDAPGGTFVGLSFACTAVLQNVGPAVEDQRAELDAHATVAVSRRDATRPIRLTHRHEISTAAYDVLEDSLRAILALDQFPLSLRLVAQGVYLDIFDRLLRLSRGDEALGDAAASLARRNEDGRFPEDCGKAPDVDIAALARERQLASAPGLAQLFRIAAKARPRPAIQRVFLGLLTTFRKVLRVEENRSNRFLLGARILRHYFAHAARLGRVHLVGVERPFEYEEFDRLRFEPDADRAQEELLRRYFDHAIFRKDLLLAENAWLGQRWLLMGYGLVRWYSVGIASAAGRDRILLEDVQAAVRAVERHFAFHTPFGRLFEEVPPLAMVLDAFVSRPTFAPSMVGPTN